MQIYTHSFDNESIKGLKEERLTKDWPVVYILKNRDEMYIGETINASSRLRNHLENPARQVLTHAHIIVDEESNKSSALDTESWLIQYLVADGNFKLQNGNSGLQNHNYYDREKYRAKFEVLWKDLQTKKIASKDLVQIQNSDIFKYSPYKALTEEQLNIVDLIKKQIKSGIKQTSLIEGEPGSGKSVLATYLIKNLTETYSGNFKVALVVPQTSLRKTLKKVFTKIPGLRASMVIGPSDVVGKNYDLIIVDEAHRLKRRVNITAYGSFDSANNFYGLGKSGTQLDWVMNSSKSQVLFYDKNQSVMPSDIRASDIENLNYKRYKLRSQLRVSAGDEYIKFIDKLLNLQPVDMPELNNYELTYFDRPQEMLEKIKQKDNIFGLSRLVAGNAWTWETKRGGEYDIDLDGLKLKWNSTNIDWVNSNNAINEVGCIHTVQGYDLNYVGVIIGPEIKYNPKNDEIIIDKEKYMDFNGVRSIESLEELKSYIINIYKTLLTRGILGTYLHAVDKDLEKYLKKFITEG
jgi:DUF2075 family protein/predicted GIY-YIG superfamily endonuclease